MRTNSIRNNNRITNNIRVSCSGSLGERDS